MAYSICLCRLKMHDFFFYVSHEQERSGIPEPYINNTALLYALNRIDGIHRLTSGTSPHYEEDKSKFKIYATPAELLSGERTKISYNAVDEPLAFWMKEEKAAIPKFGSYHRFTPLTCFQFFTIGLPPPPIVRIGKKLIAARIRFTEAEEIHCLERGHFHPNHPVNYLDLPKETKIRRVGVKLVPPGTLLTNAELEGPHFRIKVANEEYVIAIPDFGKFKNVVGE